MTKKLYISILSNFILCLFVNVLEAQEKKAGEETAKIKMNLSLQNVVDLAIAQSSAVK